MGISLPITVYFTPDEFRFFSVGLSGGFVVVLQSQRGRGEGTLFQHIRVLSNSRTNAGLSIHQNVALCWKLSDGETFFEKRCHRKCVLLGCVGKGVV